MAKYLVTVRENTWSARPYEMFINAKSVDEACHKAERRHSAETRRTGTAFFHARLATKDD